MTNPHWHERIISPHTLVYTGFRWHVRAYCHKSRLFKDFLLSRIERTPVTVYEEAVDPSQDQAWQEELTLNLIPNPKLSDAQKVLVERDYGMPDGRLQITVKTALAHYSLQRFQAAINEEEASNTMKYPLVLQANDMKKVLPSLFGHAQSSQGD